MYLVSYKMLKILNVLRVHELSYERTAVLYCYCSSAVKQNRFPAIANFWSILNLPAFTGVFMNSLQGPWKYSLQGWDGLVG